MLALWIAIALFALVCAIWLVLPFLRRAEVELNEADSAISIFRDQTDELKRDLNAGLINQDEFEAA